jgi:putative membrane protein insertion efficiency factor
MARLLLALIWLYRHSLSYLIGRQCRFTPSCSRYAEDAIRQYGAWRGSGLALRRIGRCHPWGGSGYDPVPPRVKLDNKV